MRPWTISLILGLAVGASALTAPAQADDTRFDPAPFAISAADVRIPGSGGVTLDGLVYRPAGVAPAGGWPLIVFPASWSLPKAEYEAIARRMAAAGYLGIAYTPRGFYSSTGTILAAGPEDQADLSALISWAERAYPVNGSKVGTFGVSYGAGIGLLGAVVDRRIRAVVALSGWSDLEKSLVPGGTVAVQAANLLEGVGKVTGTMDPIVEAAFSSGVGGDTRALAPLAATRSPGRRIAQINVNGPAIMVGNGWQDSLLPASQWFSVWDKLTVPKQLMLQPGDHAVSEAGGLAGLSNDYVQAGEAWLEHYLGGVANRADKQGSVLLKPTLGGPSWTSLNSVASLTRSRTRRYLGKPSGAFTPGASLTGSPADFAASFTGGSESSAAIGLVLVSGAAYAMGAPPKSVMGWVDRSKSLVWQTVPLDPGVTLGGTAKVHLTLTPTGARSTVVAYLYDVDRLGIGTLLSWQPWTRTNLTSGRRVPVNISLEPVFQTVAAGHRLALVVDSSEERYRSETAAGQTIRLSGTAADPAYISLPCTSLQCL